MNQRDVIQRLVVLWLLVERHLQRDLGQLQVVKRHAHDAEVHVRDSQGQILSRSQLKVLRRPSQVIQSLLFGLPRRTCIDESQRDHELGLCVVLNRPLHQRPCFVHLAVYQVHHRLRVQRLRLVRVSLQYPLDNHLGIFQVTPLDRLGYLQHVVLLHPRVHTPPVRVLVLGEHRLVERVTARVLQK